MANKGNNQSLLDLWKSSRVVGKKKVELRRAPANARILLTPYQKRLWYVQQFFPDDPFYNYTQLLRFKGKLNIDYLCECLEAIYETQDVLRSYYPLEDDEPVLKITSEVNIPLEIIDLASYPEAARNTELDRICALQSRTRFDLSRAPLLKVSLIKLGSEDHILLISMHHIITDAWSFDILKNQLAHYYRTLLSVKPLRALEGEIRFSDYAYWAGQRTTYSEGLSKWKSILGGELPVLNFPADHKRPVIPKHRGSIYRRELPKELSDRTSQLIKELKITPFVYFLSLYYILIYRYTGQTDIIVGTPISNRDERSLEDLMGFFLNTLVLRSLVDPNQSFVDFVGTINDLSLNAFSNKEVPFDVLVNELKTRRSLAVHPIFQIMFLYSEKSKKPSFGEDLVLTEDSEYDTGVSKFDLTMTVELEQGQFSSLFEYDSDLFEGSTIEKLLDQLELLMENVVASPNQRIAQIPMLTLAEKQILLPAGRKHSHSLEDFSGIHQIIENIAHKKPDHVAVIYNGQKLSYGELMMRSEHLKLSILNYTKGNNEIVALCLNRSLDMVIGLMAVLKAGCAYLPIDPEYPSERTHYVLSDSKAALVLTDTELKKNFKGYNGRIILVDPPGGVQESLDDLKNDSTLSKNDLAYVIYTSGSSGKPKGVQISHENIIQSTAGRLTYYPWSPQNFLLMSSLAFDSSKAGIYWTLCTGGTLVIAENKLEQDMAKLGNLIETHGISHTLMLPSLYQVLLENVEPSKLKSLNTVIVAGESCPGSLVSKHFEKLASASLYNEYGPTEATVWCAAHQISIEDGSGNVPIGKTVANAEIYLLNKDFQLVPLGAIGEIFIGGPGLSKGYLHNSRLTSTAFVDVVLSDNHNIRLYRSGDLGKFRKDGTLEFLGRSDQQIKIRGHRIELEEINRVLQDSNFTKEAVVIAQKTEVPKADDINPMDETSIYLLMEKYLRDEQSEELLQSIVELSNEEKKYLLKEMNQQSDLNL